MTSITHKHPIGVETVKMHIYCAKVSYVTALFEYNITITHEVLSFCLDHAGHIVNEKYNLITNSILHNNDSPVVKKLQKLAEESDDEVYRELADAFVKDF
jgi:hypothetical protein